MVAKIIGYIAFGIIALVYLVLVGMIIKELIAPG